MEYFCCYHSYRRKIAKLSDQEVGRLFRSLLDYSETGETQELTGRESIAFDFIADDIDRSKMAYAETCARNKQNIEKRYDRIRPYTTVYETYQTKTKNKTKSESKENIPPKPPKGPDDDRFDEFWACYPKKVGKGAARKAFSKVKVPVETLISALETQKKSPQWTRDNGQYIPNPATWLNQGRWEDEVNVCGDTCEDAGRRWNLVYDVDGDESKDAQ